MFGGRATLLGVDLSSARLCNIDLIVFGLTGVDWEQVDEMPGYSVG